MILRRANAVTAAAIPGCRARGSGFHCVIPMVKSHRLFAALAGISLIFTSCTTPEPTPGTASSGAVDAPVAALSALDQQLLDACLAQNKVEVVRLLDAGANANAKNSVGRTPLMALALGAPGDPVQIGDPDWSNLGTAVLKNLDISDMLRALTAKGADLNIQEGQGYTALMFACLQGNSHLVGRLLKAEANRSLKNEDGLTALEIAKAKSNTFAVLEFDKSY